MDLLKKEKLLRLKLRELDEKATKLWRARQKLKEKIKKVEARRLKKEEEEMIAADLVKKAAAPKPNIQTRLEREFMRALGWKEVETYAVRRSYSEDAD